MNCCAMDRLECSLYSGGSPLHRENRENGEKKYCQGKHRESEKITKTNLDAGYVCYVSCVYVIVTHHF